MSKHEKLADVLVRHQFEDLTDRLAQLEKDERALFIGILGEFSAGKSTLVNAMLGRKLLPAMEKPTTARITEIFPESDRDSLAYFLRSPNGLAREVSVLDFDDALLTSGEDVALVKTPTNELIHDGYCIVDTPGLASLDETHSDITFGYLPLLAGSVICHDINKGGLTASLRGFLSKREVRPFFGRILFILTRSDTKTAVAAEELRQAFVQELSDLAVELRLSVRDMDARVLTLSPARMLDSGQGRSTFADVLQRTFVQPRADMLKEGFDKEIKNLTQYALDRLNEKRDNHRLDRSQYAERRLELLGEIERLETEHRELDRAVDALAPELRRIIDRLTSTLQEQLTTDVSHNEEHLRGYQRTLQSEISNLLQKRLSLPGDLSVQASGAKLSTELQRITSRVEAGKFAANAVMVTAINYYTAGTGGTAASAMLTAAGQAVADDLLVGAGSAAAMRSAQGSKLGRAIGAINPVEHAANFIGEYFSSKAISAETDRMAEGITTDVLRQVKALAHDELFEPKRMAAQTARQHLDTLMATEKADAAAIEKQREQIEKDILQLV